MTGYEFCKWLEGVLDMTNDLTAAQIVMIREKMATVKSPQQLAAEQSAKPTQSGPVARC